MLDSPQWASRIAVRDREVTPVQMLVNSMGWGRIANIWLPVWLQNPYLVVDAVVKIAQEAELGSQPEPVPEPEPEPAQVGPVAPTAVQPISVAPRRALVAEDWVAEDSVEIENRRVGGLESERRADQPIYSPASGSAEHDLHWLDEQGQYNIGAIGTMAGSIIAAEAPLLLDRLVVLVANRSGISRVQESRKKMVLGLLRRLQLNVQKAPDGTQIVWPQGADPGAYKEFRVPAEGSSRDPLEIPYQELRNAMVSLAEASGGIAADDLIRETCRAFGNNRLGSRIKARLESVLKVALREGRLVAEGDLVSVPATS
jgi:hypothetical protein